MHRGDRNHARTRVHVQPRKRKCHPTIPSWRRCPRRANVADAWEKTLRLDYGLSISASIYPKEKLTGFGLVISKGDSSFSWEWFDRDDGDVFRKLLGGGKVRVSVLEATGSQELVSVEFLDDMVLACEDKRSGVTHEVHVKKGSVLRVKP